MAFCELSELTPGQAAALREVTVETFTDGKGADAREVRRVKFKLADKLGALLQLGRPARTLPGRSPAISGNIGQ